MCAFCDHGLDVDGWWMQLEDEVFGGLRLGRYYWWRFLLAVIANYNKGA